MLVSELGIGKKKCVYQNWGPGKKSDLKTGDRKKLCTSELGLSNIFPVPCFEIPILLRSQFFFGPYFGEENSVLVFSFKIHFCFPVPYSETQNISRIFEKCKLFFICIDLEEKNHATVIRGQAFPTDLKTVFGDRVPLKMLKYLHILPFLILLFHVSK